MYRQREEICQACKCEVGDCLNRLEEPGGSAAQREQITLIQTG